VRATVLFDAANATTSGNPGALNSTSAVSTGVT
jgi:hypothetical protein